MALTITLELPEDVVQDLREAWPDMEHAIAAAVVAEGYRQGFLGRSQVGAALGIEGYWETMEWLTQRHLFPNMGPEGLDEEVAYLEAMWPLPEGGTHPPDLSTPMES